METKELTVGERLKIRRAIAVACRERMSALNITGKKRDDACLHYLIGAAKALELGGQTRMSDTLAALVFIVAIRGFKEVQTVIDDIP